MWRSLKWLSGVLATGVVPVMWLLLSGAQLGQHPWPILNQAILWSGSYPNSALCIGFGWALLWGSIWIKADHKERIRTLRGAARLFTPVEFLQPEDLDLEGYHEFYVERDEDTTAHRLLSDSGRLLVLGESRAGKSRMAYELATRSLGWWVLRLHPGFGNWEKLNLNLHRSLSPLKIIWILDDLDKFVGRLGPHQAERVLRESSSLRILITCRSGEEFERILKSDDAKELRAWLEGFKRVTCSDLSADQISLLAAKVGVAPDTTLYDGTPGSVTLDIQRKRDWLENSETPVKQVMRALFLLRVAGISAPSAQLLRSLAERALPDRASSVSLDEAIHRLEIEKLVKVDSNSIRPAHDFYVSTQFFKWYSLTDSSELFRDMLDLQDLLSKNETQGEELFSLGLFWLRHHRPDHAVESLQLSAARLGTNPWAFNALGRALAKKDDDDAAVQAYSKAVRLSPKETVFRYNLAKAHFRLGNFEQALLTFGKALDLDPSYAWAYRDRGLTHKILGNYEAALRDLRHALSLPPGVRHSAYLALAELELASGKVEAGIGWLRHGFAGQVLNTALTEGEADGFILEYDYLLKSKSPSAPGHIIARGGGLGCALAMRGRYDEAERVLRFRVALKAHPEASGSVIEYVRSLGTVLTSANQEFFLQHIYIEESGLDWLCLGAISLVRGDFDAATVNFSQAIRRLSEETHRRGRSQTQLDRTLAEAHYGLGLALQSAGRSHEASAEFAFANRIDSRFKPPEPGWERWT